MIVILDWQPPESWDYDHKTDHAWQRKDIANLRHNVRVGYDARRPVNAYLNPLESYSRDSYYQNSAGFFDANGARRYSYKNNPKNFWNDQR